MPRNATIDEMVDAIRQAEKPVTEAEIGDAVGVARRTVGNHREKLQARDEIAYRKIGKAWAYWAKNQDGPTDFSEFEPPSEPSTTPPNDLSRGIEETVAETVDEPNQRVVERNREFNSEYDETYTSNEITNLTMVFTGAVLALFPIVQFTDARFALAHGSFAFAGIVVIGVGFSNRLDKTKSRVKNRLTEAGEGLRGGVRMAREIIRDEHPAPNNPASRVESIAWWDVKSIKWIFTPTMIVGVSLYLAVEFWGAGGLIDIVGPTAVFWWLAIFIIGMYAWPMALVVATIAQWSVVTSQRESQQATLPLSY